METNEKPDTQFSQQIKKLLSSIQNVTIQMSNTFQQGILKHEQQFIRTYKIKITQLVKLFQELTRVLEDKFINNQLTTRLNIVMKQRDYFKYECLKLNVQYQTVLNQQNNHSGQIASITDQMKIYKHLLEEEKIKNQQLQKTTEKLKNNFSQIAYKTLSQTLDYHTQKQNVDKKKQKSKNNKIESMLNQLQQKNQIIRNLKLKLSSLQQAIIDKQAQYIQKKQLYQTFKCCTNSWKRDLLTKSRKNFSSSLPQKKALWNPQKLSLASKQQLLQHFFTNHYFLSFLQKLLFNPSFKVQFVQITPQGNKWMNQNRIKLYDYMRQKKIISVTPFS